MRFARRWWWVPVAAISVAVFVAVELREPSQEIHPAFADTINTLRINGDCVALQDAFDRSNDPAELQYIDDALRRAGCYD